LRRGNNNPQGGRPAIGLVMQKLHVRKIQPAELVLLHKGPRLLQIKPQSRAVDFQHLILGAQRSERKRRFCSAGQHHMAIGRRMLEKECQSFMDSGVGDPMIILQEQIYLVVYIREVVYQH